jgi:hypothetical protein
MAARAVVHEVARAALQGLDVLDIRDRFQQRNFTFIGQRITGAEKSKGD